MKIVYCIRSLHQSGGTERVLTTKMNYLADQKNYEIHVIMQDGIGTPFFTLSPKILLHNLHEPDISKYKKALTSLLLQLKADIVICTGGSEISFLWKISDGSKKIYEFHYTKNFLINFVKGIRKIRFKQLHLLKVWLQQKRIGYYTRKFDKVVGLTQRDVHLWGDPKNMTYIYNPLSFRSKTKSSLQNKKIIAVGSLTPAKGMDLLIEAFGKIAHKHQEWTLEIYGSGQDYELLKYLIKKYAIENQVTICSPVPDIKERLLESSIYAFPSRSDGFGLVITEAMECGLPCVAFDCECGPREIVSPDTGILIPPQDTNEFSVALERLICDTGLRESMGTNATKEVTRFYVENIMPQWMQLFDQLTAK